jgi:TetR/AcrR family transcriptional regulator
MAELRPVYSSVDARDKILAAALAVFAEMGFHGATIRIIAERAGVSQGLVPHHFGDKEKLWARVGERVAEDFLEFMSPAIDVETVDRETIPALLQTYMRYWREHPSIIRLQLWRMLGAPEAERRAQAEARNQRLVPVFAQAQKAGFVRNDIPPGQAMITAISVIQYRLHSQMEMEGALAITDAGLPDDDEFLAYVCKLIAVGG